MKEVLKAGQYHFSGGVPLIMKYNIFP